MYFYMDRQDLEKQRLQISLQMKWAYKLKSPVDPPLKEVVTLLPF